MFGKKAIEKFDCAKFRQRAVAVSAAQDADALFAALEQAMAQSTAIVVEDCLRDDMARQVLMQFLGRYKLFVAYCYMDAEAPGGRCCVQLKQTWDPHAPKSGYAALENAYTENYYLQDCGGYDSFVKSHGEQIDYRLQAVLCLADPRPGEKILDIGCGRGELSYALARQGADVTGVDYSPSAIGIATSTYANAGGGIALRYLQRDIFQMEDLQVYDKMIMADVVEHIEQEVLEKIFAKLARCLSPNGTLIVHTAPNRHYYEQTWPLRRQQAAQLGCWLPREPRSYYEQLMHINEQTPEGLQAALCRYFPHVHVWTGGAMDCAAQKDAARQTQDMEIFAYAANSRAALDAMLAQSTRAPRFEDCRLALTVPPLAACSGQQALLEVTVENLGSEVLTSFRRNPIHLCYHILDSAGEVCVYDGERSPIALLPPGGRQSIPLRVSVPASLPSGQYRLRVTAVAEELFWLDAQGTNCADADLTVT